MSSGQDYYNSLLLQGYPHHEALTYTKQHFLGFNPIGFESFTPQVAPTSPVLMPRPAGVNPTPQLNLTFEPLPQKIEQAVATKKNIPVKSISIAAVLITAIIVISILPPGTIPIIDEVRDRDSDGLSDAEELALGTDPMNSDTDGDTLDDIDDDCPNGDSGWVSNENFDMDTDGCRDSTEDQDDDGDGIFDEDDNCARGEINWTPTSLNDIDSDGCMDDGEDTDDDGDGKIDSSDDCPLGYYEGWTSKISSDWDRDGCKDDVEDNDDDGDGVIDIVDMCSKGDKGWTATTSTDIDGDGCRDSGEDDDDDDDNIKDVSDDCPRGSTGWKSMLSTDNDGDGCKDSSEDDDDDNDGVVDNADLFPLDSTEWSDFDEDGIGDNADTDDDNDGIVDSLDANDFADTGLLLSFDLFEVITQMDWLDNQAEVYICMYVESEIVGCGPDEYYWSLTTSTQYSLDVDFFVDLPEENGSHFIQICAWDDDISNDDRIDISPLSTSDCYGFYFDSTTSASLTPTTILATGVGDDTGWDGELQFTYEFIDVSTQRFNQFTWEYDGKSFSMDLSLNYDTYAYFKNLDHTVGGIYDVNSYAEFMTPHEDYVIELANDLESMAIQNGYTTQLEIAEFVYAFVGEIQYVLDIEGSGVSDYPKYPIEMLWEASGDCEDAAILYISLIEGLGYDAMFVVGLVKQTEEHDWGGHAWAVVHIPDHTGAGWYGPGSKSEIPFYFVEATAYYDGTSYIGRNPWYEITDESFYDVE